MLRRTMSDECSPSLVEASDCTSIIRLSNNMLRLSKEKPDYDFREYDYKVYKIVELAIKEDNCKLSLSSTIRRHTLSLVKSMLPEYMFLSLGYHELLQTPTTMGVYIDSSATTYGDWYWAIYNNMIYHNRLKGIYKNADYEHLYHEWHKIYEYT